MALKLILACLLTGFAMLAGRAFAGAQVRAADGMRTLMDDLQMLRALTLERLLPMCAALAEMRAPALRAAGDFMKANGDLPPAEAWARAAARETARGGSLEGVSPEDAGEVTALFNALTAMGRREHEGQYAQTIARLGRREEELRKKGMEKMKLYASLGALAGLAASVFLV